VLTSDQAFRNVAVALNAEPNWIKKSVIGSVQSLFQPLFGMQKRHRHVLVLPVRVSVKKIRLSQKLDFFFFYILTCKMIWCLIDKYSVFISFYWHCIYTVFRKKMWQYICDHNSGKTCLIFVIFALL